MLVSDGLYNRLPTIWIVLGAGFIVTGLAAGPELNVFWGILLLGFLSIWRGVQIIQSRKSILKKTQVIVLTETQKLRKSKSSAAQNSGTSVPTDVHL